MMVLVPLDRLPAAPAAIREALSREPLFAVTAILLALAILPTSIAFVFDDRLVDGVPAWSKPIKFQAALAIYLATLAWFAAWTPRRFTASPIYKAFAAAVVVSVALEMVWIAGAAAYGVRSHFNVATPAMARIYSAMGVLAITLTSASLVLGAVILRARDSGGDPVLRLAIGIGLTMTFVLTMLVAGPLADNSGHLVGVDAQTVRRLPFLGWARNGGDLRVAHFFAIHAMHAVPLAGWMAARLLRAPQAAIAVILFAVAYVILVAWTYLQARAGNPFLPDLG